MSEIRQSQHKILLTDRELLEVTGVLNVEKFTDDDVILETQLGMLGIKGEKMHMKQLNLDGGLIIMEGAIKSMSYSETAGTRDKGKSLFNKLFK